ncbi:hypothetical protein ART_0180 [Arthrobacter sp. PAMC 25486]|uniref:hypothetical protein n=1 Tax=Arthrobacter sp. PAMC 25486 TaxID=1494608 RepID=UPI000535DF4D|nr:hypothetical protein [Arthrobacter sp. PAMC 25486]AIX99778.1 hypothetical protein ART_0180 [Arthrobacter sp. PAMC 25486]
MEAFATIDDLSTRVKRVYEDDEVPSVEAALEDASEYLRDLIGQNVYPQQTATFRTRVRAGDLLDLPQQPVVAVDSVTIGGSAVVADMADGGFYVHTSGIAEVTFTYGFSEVPGALKLWTCVLASQAIELVETLGTLGTGGLSSTGVDDFRRAWADAGANAGYALPERQEVKLVERYGRAVFVTGER